MIAALLARRAAAYPDAPWLSMLEDDEILSMTFGQAWHHTRRYASALRQIGVGPSTRIALGPSNSWPDVLTVLGALSLGAHVWMVNASEPSQRLTRQTRARRPDLLFGELPGATKLRPGDPDSDLDPYPVTGQTAALLFNTSGSTGVPKAVVQSHAAVLANARSFAAHHKLRPGRLVLGFLPIHHVNAVHSNLMASLQAGCECLLLRPDSLLRLHRWIESSHPYLVSLVPSAADALMTVWRRPAVPAELHHVLSAASALSTRTARGFHTTFGRRIVQGYGLSETMNFSTTVPIDLAPPTYARVTFGASVPSIGVALPHVEVGVFDRLGERLADGEVGEICVRGTHLMSGYDDDPVATAEAFRGSWFRTGDLGYQESLPAAGAFHYITGRLKNVAKVRGEQIGLEEIEAALLKLPGVVDAVCAGEPDERDGERILAGLVLDSQLQVAELRRDLAAVLPSFAIPAEYVRLNKVPRTPTGKILRTETLQTLLAARRESTSSI